MTFKIFSNDLGISETLGQSWKGQSRNELIDLCEAQTIEPVLRKKLPRTGTILEAGCGTGRWVYHFSNLGYRIIGLELDSTAINAAREYLPKDSIQAGNVLAMPFANETFDSVISLGVIEHFEDGMNEPLQELWRVLKPGGLAFVSIPTVTIVRMLFAHPLAVMLQIRRKLKRRKQFFAEYRYSKKQFISALSRNGFTVETIHPDDFIGDKSIGLYTDFFFLQDKNRPWHLNKVGLLIDKLIKSLNPFLACGGILCVCRKK